MRLAAAMIAIAAALATSTLARAEVKTSTVTQYDLKDGSMQMTNGTRTVTILAPDRTEVIAYKVDETGETPLTRTLSVNQRKEKETVSIVTVERYENKEFVLSGRTTTLNRFGVVETIIESMDGDRMVVIQRVVRTVSASAGIVNTVTMKEERIDGRLHPSREDRVVRIDFKELASSKLPEGIELEQVVIAHHGIQTVSITKTLVDGVLKVTCVRSQLDE